MKIERRIDKILSTTMPALANGEESIDSILGKYPGIEDELRPRLEAAAWLQQLKHGVEPRPGYVRSSRTHLENQIQSLRPTSKLERVLKRFSPQRWAFNIAAPIIVVLILSLMVNSTILFAHLSIPGEPMYQSKLVIEDLRLALTFDQVHKTNLHMQFSRERTTEFVELVLEGEYEQLPSAAERLETEIIASLRALNEIPEERAAEERAIVNNLSETLSNEMLLLNILKTSSPSPAHRGIELAINAAQSGLLALR